MKGVKKSAEGCYKAAMKPTKAATIPPAAPTISRFAAPVLFGAVGSPVWLVPMKPPPAGGPVLLTDVVTRLVDVIRPPPADVGEDCAAVWGMTSRRLAKTFIVEFVCHLS
jgi:hypothetical protein